MVDAVMTRDGHSYSKDAIERWFATSHRSPVTNLLLNSRELLPNYSLRNLLDELEGKVLSAPSPRDTSQTRKRRRKASSRTSQSQHLLFETNVDTKLYCCASLHCQRVQDVVSQQTIVECIGEECDGFWGRKDGLGWMLDADMDLLRPSTQLMVFQVVNPIGKTLPSWHWIPRW